MEGFFLSVKTWSAVSLAAWLLALPGTAAYAVLGEHAREAAMGTWRRGQALSQDLRERVLAAQGAAAAVAICATGWPPPTACASATPPCTSRSPAGG